MKLADYQIKHIESYIEAQSIWYTDIKDELTDHVASAIESKMEKDQIGFAMAFGLVIEEVKPEAIQRQKMLRSFSMPYYFIAKQSLSKNILLLFGIAISLFIVYALGSKTAQINTWMSTILVAAATTPALWAIAARKHRPHKMSYFMAAVLGCFMYVQYLDAFKHFVLDHFWAASLSMNISWYTLSFFVLIKGYQMIGENYRKVKKHAIS